MVKSLPVSAGDASSIPGSGRSPGRGNGNPLEYSCLGNPMDRGAWWATVHGVTKGWTQLRDWENEYLYLSLVPLSGTGVNLEFGEGNQKEWPSGWSNCVTNAHITNVYWVLDPVGHRGSHSVVSDSATPWTVAYQAPLSMEFPRREYWSGLHSLLQGIFPTQGSNLGLRHCRQMLYHLSHQGSLRLHLKNNPCFKILPSRRDTLVA